MEICRAERRHIPAIHDIERKCFSCPWGREGIESEIAYENGIMLVAEEDNRAVGYLSLRYVLDEGYLNNVAVLPDYRGRGFARALLTRLQEECEELGLAFITLEVRISNETAKALYRSLGYEMTGRRRRFYRLPEEDALLFTKRLSEYVVKEETEHGGEKRR